jgi:hypothetical protein
VETRALVQAVKRNIQRFPQDFMFQLNLQDVMALRSQIVTFGTVETVATVATAATVF